MTDAEHYIEQLTISNPLREPTIRLVIRDLQLPPGSRGLDAGCGIGLQLPLLVEAVGSAGHITGLDLSPEFLEQAEKIVKKANMSGRISLKQGDVNRLPFENDSFDWVWSADCAGYRPGDSIALLKELARVVKPGGSVIILAWSSQMLLPGHPFLEARLNATPAGGAPFIEGMKPAKHFLRALSWFPQAGLVESVARAYVGDVQAPLSPDIRKALVELFRMRWGTTVEKVPTGIYKEFLRLCQPASPDFILDIPGYYAFFTYSLFSGKVPGRESASVL